MSTRSLISACANCFRTSAFRAVFASAAASRAAGQTRRRSQSHPSSKNSHRAPAAARAQRQASAEHRTTPATAAFGAFVAEAVALIGEPRSLKLAL